MLCQIAPNLLIGMVLEAWAEKSAKYFVGFFEELRTISLWDILTFNKYDTLQLSRQSEDKWQKCDFYLKLMFLVQENYKNINLRIQQPSQPSQPIFSFKTHLLSICTWFFKICISRNWFLNLSISNQCSLQKSSSEL